MLREHWPSPLKTADVRRLSPGTVRKFSARQPLGTRPCGAWPQRPRPSDPTFPQARAGATAIGLTYYDIGNTARHFRGSLDILLGVVAVAVIVGFFIYARRAEDRYAARAEQEFPGPFEES